MERAKNTNEKVEVVHEALHQLLEERKRRRKEEEEEDLLLSNLLLRLESLEKDGIATEGPEESAIEEEPEFSKPVSQNCEKREVGMDEIARELRKVKKQNLITHCLLSVMLVITAVWQFNEVSLLLAVRDKLSHPLRTVGDVVKRCLKGNGKRPQIEALPLPPIAVPELSNADLLPLTLRSEE
ncbi:unnamed protein product [Musa acuminata subsp. malaccensis]|uniref:(wild Malaysian banana) hypothetical protein n=1 Tax=Musa acuminata subsp. malaccensis TaxID=214687 RepID=A0A804KEP6_MUSAM|nr:PREDICTED: uncharacterized protein LOC103996685 [Musa acuminata subsp. malaccensis]CAG1833877.1 unnamed protein product [Musa acuminata subsp. malaccensis]